MLSVVLSTNEIGEKWYNIFHKLKNRLVLISNVIAITYMLQTKIKLHVCMNFMDTLYCKCVIFRIIWKSLYPYFKEQWVLKLLVEFDKNQ